MPALFFAPPLGHPVHQRCSLLKRPARLQPDPLRCHHAGGSCVRISLTYTKSVLFPYPLSSCSPLFTLLILTLHYYIVYFCTLHVIIYFCDIPSTRGFPLLRGIAHTEKYVWLARLAFPPLSNLYTAILCMCGATRKRCRPDPESSLSI